MRPASRLHRPWHDWQSLVIAGSRGLMGEVWLDAFLEAPVWRFVLPPGLCGARAAVGLMLPSVDKVGRYFPLSFAALPATRHHRPKIGPTWLDAVENLGRLALDEDAPPERLAPPPRPRQLPTPARRRACGGPTAARASKRNV